MSLLQPKNITFDIGGGRNVTIETGKLADLIILSDDILTHHFSNGSCQ